MTLSATNTTGSAITFDLDDLGTGTALSGSDYTAIAANAQISVANGASTGTLTVLVTDDALLETTETVIAQISNSSNAAATIGTASATANITNNDTATANLSVTTHGNETGPVHIVYTVTLSKTNNTGTAITFDLDDLGTGTATSGSDYTAIAGNAVISIANGATTGSLTVLVTDDTDVEATETVTVQISNSSNASVTIGTASATANITNNDVANQPPTAVVLTPSSFSLAENASTASATVLSTISVTDDGMGTNTLSLSGADAASFEIVGNSLRLKAGVALDFEAKSSYSVRVNVDDASVGGTPDAFADFTLNITDIADAPSLTWVVVNSGEAFSVAAQRSQITSLVVTFSVPVVLGVNPFAIVDNGLTSLLGSPVAVNPTQILVTGSGTTFTIRFGAGPGVITRDSSTGLGRGNSLADGNFLLTIDPSKVTDLAAVQTLTPTNSFGDGDNEFGDRAVDNFFRLFGDADGNGVVNSLDTGAFARAISTYNAAVDFDGNGSVTNSGVDRTNFLGNFNKRRRSF